MPTEILIFPDSDITALAKDKAYAQIHLDEMNIHQVIARFLQNMLYARPCASWRLRLLFCRLVLLQALQLGQDANPSLGFNGQRCQMCLRSDPLHKVMERLANPGTLCPSIFCCMTKYTS